MIKGTVKESLCGPMAEFTMEAGKKVNSMELESSKALMAKLRKVNGRTERGSNG